MSLFSSLSFRQRNYALGAGTLLLGSLAYVVALRPTLDLYADNARRREQLRHIGQAPQTIRELRNRVQRYGWLTQSVRSDSARQDSYLLNQLTRTCRPHRVTLAALSPAQQHTHATYRIDTRVAKLRGSFQDLTRVVYELEYNRPVGRLSSVRYCLEEDRRQRRSYLYAYVHLQQLSPSTNEFR